MNLIFYEIKKVFSQKFIGSLCLLIFFINAVLCIFTAIQDNNKIPDKYWNAVMEIYKISPKTVEDTNITLREDIFKQVDAFVHAIENGEPELPIIMQFNYINYKNFTDFDLFGSFIEYRDKVENYKKNLQLYINQAIRMKQDIEDIDNNATSFSYNYQNQIISKYNRLLNEVNFEFDYVYGWDRLFSYDSSGFLGLVTLLFIGCVIFSYDKNCGIDVIIKTTKKGKYPTIWTKIIAGIILAIIISISFSLSTFIIIGIFRGYSNPLNAVQLLSDYLLCPFNTTFVGAYIISSLLKIGSCIVFVLIVSFISVFFNKYAFTLFGGAFLIAINYIISITNTSSQYKFLNLLSISSTYDMLSRYHAVSIFNEAINFLIVAVVTAIIICIICIIGIVLVFPSHKFNINFILYNNIKKQLELFKYKIINFENLYKKNNIVNYPKSFFTWEVSKHKIFIFISLLLIIIKVYYTFDEYNYKKSFNDDAYKEYMTYLAGIITDEKVKYIDKEIEYINYTNNIIEEMSKKYITEKITFGEYEAYIKEYKYSYARKDIIVQIKEQADYLLKIKNLYNIEACFIYDTGLLKIIERKFDILIYIIIMLFSGRLYICEYNNKNSGYPFSYLLRTTKNGRQKTFKTKLITSVCIALFSYIIFNFIDIFFIFYNYKIPNLNIPIISIKSYENISFNISIIQYLLIIMVIYALAVIILSIISVTISQLLKKAIPAYSLIVLLTFIPHMLSKLDIHICKYIDFTNFMAPDKLYKFSIYTKIFGDYGYVFIFVSIILIISTLLYYTSYKNYCR